MNTEEGPSACVCTPANSLFAQVWKIRLHPSRYSCLRDLHLTWYACIVLFFMVNIIFFDDSDSLLRSINMWFILFLRFFRTLLTWSAITGYAVSAYFNTIHTKSSIPLYICLSLWISVATAVSWLLLRVNKQKSKETMKIGSLIRGYINSDKFRRVLDWNGDGLQIASGSWDFIEAIVTLQYCLFLEMNYCPLRRNWIGNI